MDTILVTGGTGRLGRRVVRRLSEAGGDVRALTWQTGKHESGVRFITRNLVPGAGIDAAVDGVATIMHCAGSHKVDDKKTQNLVRAATRTGHSHIVYISVVGTDRMPIPGWMDRTTFAYIDMKQRTEERMKR